MTQSTPRPIPVPASIDETLALLSGASYVAERALATVVFLSLRLGRPLFLEGEAGVGKTEVAKVLAAALGRRLIRLQCYEGLDVATAVYEWNYPAQMMAIRLAEAAGEHDKDRIEHDIFSSRYLIKRPLLQALEPSAGGAPVLLIDEIDRADEAFEAYLLEVLSDFQVTIPEIGVVKAESAPIVVITSNRTREIHDALKRRCLYHWVDYPDAAREVAIVRAKAPRASERLTAELVAFVQKIAQAGPLQVARRRRDARLGERAERTRRGGARSGAGFRHPRRAAQVPGRHRQDPGRQGARADRAGARRAAPRRDALTAPARAQTRGVVAVGCDFEPTGALPAPPEAICEARRAGEFAEGDPPRDDRRHIDAGQSGRAVEAIA